MTETAKALPHLLREAEQYSWTYQELLVALCSHKDKLREEKTTQKHLNWAHFPFDKSLENFNTLGDRALSNRQINQLKEFDWLKQAFNLIF